MFSVGSEDNFLGSTAPIILLQQDVDKADSSQDLYPGGVCSFRMNRNTYRIFNYSKDGLMPWEIELC